MAAAQKKSGNASLFCHDSPFTPLSHILQDHYILFGPFRNLRRKDLDNGAKSLRECLSGQEGSKRTTTPLRLLLFRLLLWLLSQKLIGYNFKTVSL